MIDVPQPAVTDDWMAHALCTVYGKPALWDGVKVNASKYAPLDFSEAKAICDECPVANICLERALETEDTEVMRAGKTPKELKALLKDRQAPVELAVAA